MNKPNTIHICDRILGNDKPKDYEYYSVQGDPVAFYIYFENCSDWGSSKWIKGDLNLWYELWALSNNDKKLFNQRYKELKELYKKGKE